MNLLYTNDTLFESGSGCETHDKFCVIIINSRHRGSLAVSVRILSLWLRNFIIIYLPKHSVYGIKFQRTRGRSTHFFYWVDLCSQTHNALLAAIVNK